MVLSILFLILQLGFVVFFLYMCIASINGAPFVPSKKQTAESMIKLAAIKKGATIYDLGSGNGKLLFLAESRGARAIGYEINPILVWYTNLLAFLHRQPRVHVYWKNFWAATIRDADVVFIYLLPWKMERLEQKIKNECKKGAIIVSNSFIFPNWKTLRSDPLHHVYVFRV